MPCHPHATLNCRPHLHPPHRKLRPQPLQVTLFISLHASDARGVAALSGIPVEIILAQSALETNWGRAVVGNAFFGVKGKAPSGQSTTFSTHEVRNGKVVSETDQFRAYANYREAADDYAVVIKTQFSAAMAFRSDPDRFATALARQGYATDPRYAAKLQSIIRVHVKPVLSK